MPPSLMALTRGVFHCRCNSAPKASPPAMHLEVFIYLDAEGDAVPTTLMPRCPLRAGGLARG